MPETKNNRRVRFTRSALREALIDLILEKPLVSITVKDICARADINRSTFYLHFKDVTDILRTTEDEIIEHMREHTPTHERKFHDLQEIEGFFIDFLEQIRNNPRIMKVIQVLCSEQGDPYFVRKLQTMMKAADASARQIAAIQALIDSRGEEAFPGNLWETVRLRLEYPTDSLSELAQRFDPPISKPGLSHRLKKIIELAEKED